MPPPAIRLSRTLGALLGVHAGDSLGATLEFKSHQAIKQLYPSGLRDIIGGGPFHWAPGHATDDTDLTRAVLLAYRDAHRAAPSSSSSSSLDLARSAGDHMLAWFRGDPWPDREPGSDPPDIGGATSTGLTRFAASRDPRRAGAGEGAAGNGSLMRCIPTALFQPDGSRLREESVLVSRITHDDARCTVGCAAYNVIANHLVARGSAGVDEALRAGAMAATEMEGDSRGPVSEAIRQGRSVDLARAAEDGPPEGPLTGRASGYVLDSLVLAVAAVLDQRPLEDVLVDVVRVGMDTDTNGAIAGGLLGARDGVEAIPDRWLDKLQYRDEFSDLARELLSSRES